MYSILSWFTTVYHVVFDELLTETGHGSCTSLCQNILKYCIVIDYVTINRGEIQQN